MKTSNPIKLAIVMDPLDSLNIKKDSTYAMIKEAANRQWSIHCCTIHDVYVDNSITYGIFQNITYKNSANWYEIESTNVVPLNDFDIILLRKDPPFNMEYIYLTYLLELVQSQGTIVANNPASVRNNNEKLSVLKFPDLTPPTIVTADKGRLLDFLQLHKTIIVKPLDAMGGRSIFKIQQGEDNTSVIIDTITDYGSQTILAQKFIPEISKGDKRILLVNGEFIPYGLARVPAQGEFRGNLAAGATGQGFELSARDKFICNQIGPFLKEQGLCFVGIDVIGDYLTEINVTCPTCIQEIHAASDINASKIYLDYLEQRLRKQ